MAVYHLWCEWSACQAGAAICAIAGAHAADVQYIITGERSATQASTGKRVDQDRVQKSLTDGQGIRLDDLAALKTLAARGLATIGDKADE